jgi:hypothetical protein
MFFEGFQREKSRGMRPGGTNRRLPSHGSDGEFAFTTSRKNVIQRGVTILRYQGILPIEAKLPAPHLSLLDFPVLPRIIKLTVAKEPGSGGNEPGVLRFDFIDALDGRVA